MRNLAVQNVLAVYQQSRDAQLRLSQELEWFVKHNAKHKIGDNIPAACGNGKLFKVESIGASVFSYDRSGVTITYHGHMLKKDGTPHATHRGQMWEYHQLEERL